MKGRIPWPDLGAIQTVCSPACKVFLRAIGNRWDEMQRFHLNILKLCWYAYLPWVSQTTHNLTLRIVRKDFKILCLGWLWKIQGNPEKSRKIHYLYIDGTKKANPCVGGARRDLDRGPDARCEPRGVSFGTFIFYIWSDFIISINDGNSDFLNNSSFAGFFLAILTRSYPWIWGKAPVLKKGFLNGGKSKLYGPDGRRP